MKRAIILVALLALSSTAAAQRNTRDQMWEFGVLVGSLSGEDIKGVNGSRIETESSSAWGLAMAYNFNSHFSLGGEITWASPDYEALIIPDDGLGNPGTPEVIRHELSMFSYSFKGTFNLLKGPLTPYAELGFGWTEVDSNIASQPPVTGCWWDPWWGYICDTFYNTYSKTRETYSGALGIRWDMDNGMSLKGSYSISSLDTSKATEDADFEIYRLDLTWRF